MKFTCIVALSIKTIELSACIKYYRIKHKHNKKAGMKLKFNQNGFGAIEGLLVIIALTLIVGVGFYVMNGNKDTKTATTANSASRQTAADTSKEYIIVPGLNTKIVRNEKNLKLQFSEQIAGDTKYTLVNTDELVNAYKKCIESSDPSQFMTPTADDLIRDADKFGPGLTREEGDYEASTATRMTSANVLKQLPDYYISMNAPIGCESEDTLAQDKFNAAYASLNTAVKQAFSSAEQL
jgi:uncharacterized protein (UPF0333 family)